MQNKEPDTYFVCVEVRRISELDCYNLFFGCHAGNGLSDLLQLRWTNLAFYMTVDTSGQHPGMFTLNPCLSVRSHTSKLNTQEVCTPIY